nr:unnamed protein product [Callosobruchus analis]
MQQRRNMAL